MNKTVKKLIVAVAALSLILVGVVGGVVAWLVAESGEVKNTFVAGKIELTIAETPNEGTGWVGKIVPGSTQEKKPTLTVGEGSEKCHVYALIDNQLGEFATLDVDADKWTLIGTSGSKTLYRYKDVVDASEAAQTLTVFTKVTYAGETITQGENGNIADLAAKAIIVSGYAHQSENIENINVADDAACAWANVTATSSGN